MLRTTQVHEQKALTNGQMASVQVNAGGKIHSIICRFTDAGAPATEANIRSSITNIRLTFNGRDIVNVSAADLYDLYETLGVNVFENLGINGAVELNLGPLAFVDPAVRRLLGFGTRNITSIQVLVTCGTLTDIDAVQVFTERTVADEILGLHCKYLRHPVTFNAVGEHTMDTMPRDPNTNYLMVLCDDGAGAIGFGEVKLNNATIIERQPREVNGVLASNKRLSQLSGYYLYNFMDGDFDMPSVGLQMIGASDLRFKTTFTTQPGANGYEMKALTLENVPTTLTV